MLSAVFIKAQGPSGRAVVPYISVKQIHTKMKRQQIHFLNMPSDTDHGPSVSIIGLSLMGSAITGAFLQKDFRTTVWNRSPDRAAPLKAEGAVLANSVPACVKPNSLTVIKPVKCLFWHASQRLG